MLNWEDKEDSPQLAAWIQQFGIKNYLNAAQINELRDFVNGLASPSNNTNITIVSTLPTGLDIVPYLIYKLPDDTLQFWNGAAWIVIQNKLTAGTNISIVGSIISALGGKFIDGTNTLDAVYTIGNVGIGTTTPQARLDIRSQGALSTNIVARIRNNTDTANLFEISGNGNVGIGTSTVAGFRLDVNGTARVQGATTLQGTNTLSGTTNITGLFSTWSCQYICNENATPFSFSLSFGGNQSLNNQVIRIAYNFRQIGGLMSQDFFQNILYDNNNSNTVTGFEWFTHQNQISSAASILAMSLRGKTLSLGTNTPSASAILQVNSTTQGFLPPRMTTTQKNAIGTPATGLQVYDITLNQMSYYNGTIWINI